MTYISSQRFLDSEIVESKKADLDGAQSVIIPCSYVGEINGVEYAMVSDHHHTMAAAKELGISIEFGVSADPEGLEGDALLEARWMDSAYYNVETGVDEF